MAEFASKGVAGSGLGLGIAGTALGLLNGGLGNVLGNGTMNCCNGPGGAYVNRYESDMAAKIAALEADVKLRDANFYTISEMGKLRDYVDNRFTGIEHEICEQKTYNAANTATVSCMSSQIATLMGLTKLVVPNSSVCPGWGNVTITPAAAPTTTG